WLPVLGITGAFYLLVINKAVTFVRSMTVAQKRRVLTIFILGLLSAIGPFSIDMYLPGFEAIARSLKTSVDEIQFSLTSFFVGIASGQIIYGPLLDRFGRKKPLIVGLFIYIV